MGRKAVDNDFTYIFRILRKQHLTVCAQYVLLEGWSETVKTSVDNLGRLIALEDSEP